MPGQHICGLVSNGVFTFVRTTMTIMMWMGLTGMICQSGHFWYFFFFNFLIVQLWCAWGWLTLKECSSQLVVRGQHNSSILPEYLFPPGQKSLYLIAKSYHILICTSQTARSTFHGSKSKTWFFFFFSLLFVIKIETEEDTKVGTFCNIIMSMFSQSSWICWNKL